jgi:hypothetical protein
MLLMGKLTISMAMFNSYVKLPEGMIVVIFPSHPRLGMPCTITHSTWMGTHESDPWLFHPHMTHVSSSGHIIWWGYSIHLDNLDISSHISSVSLPILDTLDKMTNSYLVDNPIDTKD